MIQVYADGVLAYDSRLDDYELEGLRSTRGLNKGGTAEIVMPPHHPAYALYTEYRTIVEIYRDEVLKFRGRVLYKDDDFYNNRTVTCEGELCFFQDAVSRPYLYQDSPASIFSEVVGVYNSQVEDFKKFKVGVVTVTDPNDYIRLESESAELTSATLDKLLDRCGGYIVFTTDPEDGKRVINWYATLGRRSSQAIEFGENLLDFARSGANTSLATAVLPYGAKDEATGLRVTLESVNDGIDYIVDEEAAALRGTIIRPITWDDVTEPLNLLRKAQQWLEENRYIINSLTLSALDLSLMDKDIDSYEVGDLIPVLSTPHKVDDDFLLTDITEDHLAPNNSTIVLGKDVSTLTGADVAGDDKNLSELYKVTHQITSDYKLNILNAVQATEQTLASLIEQTSEAIRLEVSQTYATNEQVIDEITTRLTQTADQFLFEFNSLKAIVEETGESSDRRFEEIHKYISFEDGNIRLGSSENAITLTIENDKISFKKNGAQFGWWDGVDFHTGNIVIEVNERAQFGHMAFVPESNGSLSFMKVR